VACEACRKRKTKCNTARPTCSFCLKRNTTCNYIAGPSETHFQAWKRKYHELEDSKIPYEELFDMLKIMPERDALGVLYRIRAGDDIGTIITHVKEGDLLLQMSSSSETRSRYRSQSTDSQYLDSLFHETSSMGLPSAGLTFAKCNECGWNHEPSHELGYSKYWVSNLHNRNEVGGG